MGGVIHVSDTLGTVTLLSQGTVALAGTILALDTLAGTVSIAANGGTLLNSGIVTAGAGGTLTASTDLTNTGSVIVTNGPAVLTAGHDLGQGALVTGRQCLRIGGPRPDAQRHQHCGRRRHADRPRHDPE